MHHLMALLCLITRALRPSRGRHAAPLVLRREVREEARANRVRRYAATPGSPRPVDPRPFAMFTPVVPSHEVEPPEELVRGYYLAHERAQADSYADRQRLGVAVAPDLARVTATAAATVTAAAPRIPQAA